MDKAENHREEAERQGVGASMCKVTSQGPTGVSRTEGQTDRVARRVIVETWRDREGEHECEPERQKTTSPPGQTPKVD